MEGILGEVQGKLTCPKCAPWPLKIAWHGMRASSAEYKNFCPPAAKLPGGQHICAKQLLGIGCRHIGCRLCGELSYMTMGVSRRNVWCTGEWHASWLRVSAPCRCCARLGYFNWSGMQTSTGRCVALLSTSRCWIGLQDSIALSYPSLNWCTLRILLRDFPFRKASLGVDPHSGSIHVI